MTRFLITIILIFTIAIFWFVNSSKYVGYIYNPRTASKDFLASGYSNLNLLAFDSESNLEKTFRMLEEKGIKIIIGPPTSAEGEMILPYLKKYNSVALSATISSTKLLNSGYIYSFTVSNKFILEKLRQLLDFLDSKKVLLVSDPSNRQYSDEFKGIFSTFEGMNLYYYNINSLKSINATDFDTVVMTIFPKDAAEVVKEMKKENPSLKFVGMDSVMAENFVNLGGQAVEGVYIIYSMGDFENPEYELISEIADFLSKHKFLSADQFKRFLKTNVIETPKGRYHYNNESIDKDVKIFMVKNGKFVPIQVF